MLRSWTDMPDSVERVRVIEFLQEITSAMNLALDPEALLEKILDGCIVLTGAETGSIMLVDKQSGNLLIRTSRGLNVQPENMEIKAGTGVTGWVALHGRPRIVDDASQEPDYLRINAELSSELAVPMLVQGKVIGVVSLDSSRPASFHADHADLVQILANLAAQIFIHLSDNKKLKIRERLHQVMLEVSRVATRSLSLTDVFREIMAIAESAFRLHRSYLMLYNRNSDELRLTATVGITAEDSADIVYRPGEGITGKVFLDKKPVFIPDVMDHPDFLNRMKVSSSRDGMGFFVCPIFSGSDVAGVFATFTLPQTNYNPDLIMEFLEIIGSIISQAITIQKMLQDETRVIADENVKLRRELSSKYRFGSLIARSDSMLRLLDKVRLIADSRASVLITGESGTGKELIASALHYNSPRREQAFIKVNCAAIPDHLLESELFGHRKGAFTGAHADKKGKFEIADGGTIFLDEIGELDFNLQSKLLRVLQEREVEPVGGRPRSIDIRVIAATNANLEVAIAERKFRSDLYYRLNVIHLEIPPLRDRKEDILPLVQSFVEKFAAENKRNINSIAPAALQLLEEYDWPGNVRQLENIIERAVILCSGEQLSRADFADVLKSPASPSVGRSDSSEETDPLQGNQELSWQEDRLTGLEGKAYATVIGEVEKKLILFALRRFRYTKTRAASFLGINRNTLDKRIKELGISY